MTRAVLSFFLISIAISAAPKNTCLEVYSPQKKVSLYGAGYIFPSSLSLKNYSNPLARHLGTYARMDPEAHDPSRLTPLKVNDQGVSIPLVHHSVNFREQKYFIYEAGESQFLPLNELYESVVLEKLKQPSLQRHLGFIVSAGERLAGEIAAIASVREAALDTVIDQLKDDVEAQKGVYTNYNFYRQRQWRINHEMIKNGDNDVYAIFDQPVSMNIETGKLETKVLATVQVSYPTRRSFPQEYLFSNLIDIQLGEAGIGTYKVYDLPTVKAWKHSMSPENLKKLFELAGKEPFAEIGRYINAENVPMPVMAQMLLTAFEKMEKRGIKTVFAFGSERNIEGFTRFYKFTTIEGFSYHAHLPKLGLPPEYGQAAVMKMEGEDYIEMIKKLKRLAGIK